jgi:quinol monooxygenase YgiN
MHSPTPRGGAVYASGVWVVEEGHEEEFTRIWQTVADEAALEFQGVTFRLLRDAENARRFVAFSGPWRSAEQIAAARALPSFRQLMPGMDEIVESAELSTYELAAEIS